MTCPPLPPRPRRVIVLEDSDVVHLQDGAYTLFNAAERNAEAGVAGGGGGRAAPVAVSRALLTLEMEVSQIMKVRGLGCARS